MQEIEINNSSLTNKHAELLANSMHSLYGVYADNIEIKEKRATNASREKINEAKKGMHALFTVDDNKVRVYEYEKNKQRFGNKMQDIYERDGIIPGVMANKAMAELENALDNKITKQEEQIEKTSKEPESTHTISDWYELGWSEEQSRNAEIINTAAEFVRGVAYGVAANSAIFRASSIKYVGSFIRGLGLLGAGAMIVKAFEIAAEFEAENFLYSEDFEYILGNSLISPERKSQLFDEAMQRQMQARKEAEQLKNLAEQFKEKPLIFGFGVGSFLTIDLLPPGTLAANPFVKLKVRFPFKPVENTRHIEFLNKEVKALVGKEHMEFVTGGAHGFENFAKARTMASIRANLGEDAVPYLSTLGPNKGNVYVGMATKDAECLWRLDINPRVPKGQDPILHINWQYYDQSSGKRYYGAINIDMTLDEYCQIINKFPRKLPFIAPLPF